MGSFALGGMIEQRTSTATSGSTTTMTLTSTTWQRFTGTANETVRLPDATTLKVGRYYRIENASSGTLTIQDGSSAEIATISPGAQREFNLYSISTAAGDWEVSNQVDLDGPLRLFATRPTEDAKLNIRANQVVSGTGQVVSTPPIDDLINAFADTTIDFLTGLTTGGDVFTDGALFSLPSGSTTGFFRRMAIVYQSADNRLDTTFSAENASQGSLTNPGALFTSLEGVPVGYIDLVAVSGSTYKSASATASVVLDKDIVIFGSGSSAGAAGDSSFKLQSISSNVGKIKKGFLIVDDGREFVTYDGVTNNVDLDFNLKSEVNTLGVTAPSATTTYYLYLDLSFAPATTVTVGDADRVAYQAQSGTSGMFVVFASTPENTNTARYIPLAVLKTDGSSDYTEFEDLARRRHDASSVAVSPLVGTPLDGVSVGSVGAVANAQGAIAAGDFPSGTASFFHLDNDDGGTISDDSANGNDLTKVGSAAFVGKGFFGRENIVTFDGVDDTLTSTAAFFNPGPSTSFSLGGWFHKSDWSTATEFMISNSASSTDRGFRLWIASGTVVFDATNTANAPDFIIQVNHSFANDSWHHFALILDEATNILYGYIDGQLVGTLGSVTQRTVTASQFRISGRQTTLNSPFIGSAQDCFFISGDALDAAEVNALYSKRFKAGALNTNTQLAGGHILTADSFPCNASNANLSFWNLGADVSDDSANSNDLSALGGTVFDRPNIFGTPNSAGGLNGAASDIFQLGGAFIDSIDNDTPLTLGGWFNVSNYTPGIAGLYFSLTNNTPHQYFRLKQDSSGGIELNTQTNSLDLGNPGFVNGTWHHFLVTQQNKIIEIYFDGISVGSFTTNNVTGTGTTFLGIGGDGNSGAENLDCAVQDFFLAKYVFSDEDIKKIVSSRIDLTGTAASVGCDNQIWEATYKREDNKIKNKLSDGWLLDAKDDKIYADFGGASADCITLKLYDGSLGTTTVPAKCFDKTYTSAPPATIAHNLASTPTSVTVLHDDLAAGQFQVLDPASHIKVNSTNIYTAGFGLLTIDATHPLRIIACAGATAIGTGATSGGAGWKVIPISSSYSASAQDDILVDTTALVTVTLPASPSAGDKVKVTDGYSNAATNNITVARNGSLIDAAAADFVIDTDQAWTEFVYMDATRGWVTRV